MLVIINKENSNAYIATLRFIVYVTRTYYKRF